jgi:hypothetical protein
VAKKPANAALFQIRQLSLSYKFESSTQQQAENLCSQFEIFPNFGEYGWRLVRCRLRDRGGSRLWMTGNMFYVKT